MTLDERLDRLHAWIASLGAFTVRELVGELITLRKHSGAEQYAGLPEDGISCQELLERLEKQGRAKREGTIWRWQEGRKEPKQANLF